MKSIKIDELKPDPLAAALASTDKETVTISGYICAVDKTTISVSETRDGTCYVEYPRSAVIAAFTDEKSEEVTLLVEANAQVKTVSTVRAGMISTQARAVGGTDSGTTCEEIPSRMNLSRLPGQPLGLSDNFLRCYDLCKSTGRGTYECIRLCQAITKPSVFGVFDDSSVTAEFDPIPDFENTLNQLELSSTVAQNVPGGPSTVPPGYGRRCRRVPYWICDSNGCRIAYYWHCIYYPLPRAQFL